MKNLETLTKNDIIDASNIFIASQEELLKGISGCAKVAKVISLAIDLDFSSSCILLERLSGKFLELTNRLASIN